MRKLLIKKY